MFFYSSIQDFYGLSCTKLRKSLSAGKDDENSSVISVAMSFLSGTKAVNSSYLILWISYSSSAEGDDILQIQKKGEHGLIVILLWDILRISNIVEVAKLSVSGNSYW